MSNPNKSYFDRYTDPVIREIDRVNIYEFENGMDYEITQSGKAINVDTIKEAQSKVLKNLKKDPAYYTNMLAAESVKMVGEYGSGKKPGKRDTAKSAESIKKDGKMPKANKQDAPYGLKDNNEMKKVKSLKESLNDSYYLDNASTEADPARYKAGSMMPEEYDFDDEETYDNYKDARVAKQARDWHYTNHDEEDFDQRRRPSLSSYLDKAPYEMDEEYVPLKDRKKPTSKELEDEWEKRKGNFKKSMASQVKGKANEDVNVKDSRTIKLTPTTKNKILTLVHEVVKAYKVTGRTGSEEIKALSDADRDELRKTGTKVTDF